MKKKIILIAAVAAIAGAEIAGAFYFVRKRKTVETQNLASQNFAAQNLARESQNSNQNESKEAEKKEEKNEVSLIAVGDMMLSRGVAGKMRAKGMGYPFLKVRDYLKTGDIVFGNLETSIAEGRKVVSGEMLFRADPGSEIALKDSGFNIVSLANNHTPNFGQKALLETFDYLNEAEVSYCGAGENSEEANQPAFIEKKGMVFAFLCYNDNDVVPSSYEAGENRAGTAFMNIKKMENAVYLAKGWADFIIVSMHSGTEYTEKINQSQSSFAHAAIDAGAEMVIGHHPHIIQKAEIYNGKYILYSLGNFIFDQMWAIYTREGMIAKIIFSSKGVEKIEFTPVLIDDYSQPRIVEGEEAESPLEKLKFYDLQ